MKSAVYLGQVRHRRMAPTKHAFRYRMFMMYLDLAELPKLFRHHWLWSAHRPALARFRREDHFGDPEKSLDEVVRDRVELETGSRPGGPIRLLTHLRYFGYVFNPASFYYCYDENDDRVEAVVVEVSNTPWGERYCYVLPRSQSQGVGRHHRFRPKKNFHVSPFMEMDVDYDWRFNEPCENLTVHMENARSGEKIFDVTLELQRKEITTGSLTGILLMFPFMTMKVIAAIYWQALRLWLKKTPVQDHPAKTISSIKEAQ